MAPSELDGAHPVPPALAERGFKFCHAFRVRYRDIDKQGIVFNGNYMAYIDYGITEYFRHLGFPWPEMAKHGFDLAVVRAVQEFRGPAYLDDICHVGVRVVRVGNSSFTARFCIWRTSGQDEGSVALEAEVTYVNYDAATRRSRPVPAAVREAIKRFEGEVEGL